MCGLCGFVRRRGIREAEDRQILSAMTSVLRHRGPDDSGLYLDAFVALGHRRLSIIDLEGGHQPMTGEAERVWVVYNGEIYNFMELRTILEEKGHTFRTRSDTEVIIHGYEEWGTDVFARLRGMFAIALWDRARHTLVLARDPVGVKPLFYTRTSAGDLIFGSELKAILLHPDVPREINPAALDAFLTLEYIPAPETIFKGIYKVPAGTYVIYRKGYLQRIPYWEVPLYTIPPEERDEQRLTEQLQYRLRDAVRSHTVSDVPVGAFLSGGVDSSTVVAFMAQTHPEPVRTFSIGFEDLSYNELPYARMVAEQYRTRHTERILPIDIVNTVEKLIHFLDEPFGDFSIFPTYLVSRTAREQVKVILSGDGGDEIFAGYEHYIAWKIDRSLRWIPWSTRRRFGHAINRWLKPSPIKKGLINRLRRFGEGWLHADAWEHFRYMMFLLDEQKEALYSPEFKEKLRDGNVVSLLDPYFRRVREADDPLNGQLYLDLKTYLPEDILTKVDRMSMAVSLEARVPLLDPFLVSWVSRLPGRMKLRGFQSKWILKRAMESYLPRKVLYREKQGFSIPMKNWLRHELKDFMLSYLNPERFAEHGLFTWMPVERWIQEHLTFRADHAHRLWALVMFQVWYEHRFKPGVAASSKIASAHIGQGTG